MSGKASSEKFSHMEGVLSVCRVIGFSSEIDLKLRMAYVSIETQPAGHLH